jgi:tetratricopeptide (TPR) repeat protein
MKMKNLFWIIFPLAMITSCKESKQEVDKQIFDFEKRVYRQSVEMGDFATAVKSLHGMLVADSTQKEYWDTLANLYYTGKVPGAALKTCEYYIKHFPTNESILKTKASTNELIHQFDSASEGYDKLYLMSNGQKSKYLFKVAHCQFYLQNYAKANELLKKVMAAKDVTSDSIDIFWEQENYTQFVNLKAAAYYLDGLLDLNAGKMADAKAKFQMSVAAYPRFEMMNYAVQNFERMIQQPRR